MMLVLLACAQVDPLTDDSAGPSVDSAGPADTAAPDDTGPSGPPSPVPGDLLVTEILYDPDVVDGDVGEWFEVRSVVDADRDLAGVTVTDDGGTGFTVAVPLLLPAGGHLVFGVEADPSVNGGVTVDHAYSVDDLKLGNDGDAVVLLLGEVVLDVVAWDAGATFPAQEGWSIQLDPAITDPTGNDDGSAWCLPTQTFGAGDHGSPGALNEPCAGEARTR